MHVEKTIFYINPFKILVPNAHEMRNFTYSNKKIVTLNSLTIATLL